MKHSIQPAVIALIAAFTATLFAAVPRRAANLPKLDVSIDAPTVGVAPTPATGPATSEPERPIVSVKLSDDVSTPSTGARPHEDAARPAAQPTSSTRASVARPIDASTLQWETKYAGRAPAELEQSLAEARARVRAMSSSSLDSRLTQGPHPLYSDANQPLAEPSPAMFIHEAQPDVAPDIRELYREIQWLAERTYADAP